MILAGGMGTRLRSVVSDIPKPLAPVNGAPFLFILMNLLEAKGLEAVVILSGFMADVLKKEVAQSYHGGLQVLFSPEESPLGTGGAVRNAAPFASDPTLLVNGDTFFDGNLVSLSIFHENTGADATLSLVHVPNAGPYGSVEIDEEGRVRRFVEKSPGPPAPGLINAGFTLISKRFLLSLPESRPFSMETDIFPTAAAQGRMFGLAQDRAFHDIGTPESLAGFCEFIRSSPLGHRLCQNIHNCLESHK
jgi:D-glycero-alpha-D-manno-heptose 1-phosphate guanylyltransferase